MTLGLGMGAACFGVGALPSRGFPVLRAVARVDRRWQRLRLFPAALGATLRLRPRLRPYAAFVLRDTLGRTLGDADAAAPRVEVLGLQRGMDGEVAIKAVDKRPLPLAALHPGLRVKVKGRAEPGGRFVPQKIKLRLPTPDAMDELESAITAIDAETRCLTVMGFRVRCGPDLEIEA